MSISDRLRRDWRGIAWSAALSGLLIASWLVDDRTQELITLAVVLLFATYLCVHVVRGLRNAHPRY